jgi:hypothetical protein
MILNRKAIKSQVHRLKKSEIKELISRKRLHFIEKEIVFYLWVLVLQSEKCCRYKSLYRKFLAEGYLCTYQNFMKNLITLAPLLKKLFSMFLKKLQIKPSKLFNIVDSTVLPQKSPKNIQQRDWDKGRVTRRKTEYICGYKGLVFLNKQGFITDGVFLNINI